jgi:3,4-dihydroxy 2-butanone 4-phosphate synthase / GTP cyclohydrolase II
MEIVTTQAVQSLAVRHLPQVDQAVESLRQGKMIILEEPGEPVGNGYLVAGAQTVTKEIVAEMLAIAHGTPFVALTAERCEALGLQPVGGKHRAHRNFMVNIEAREGTSTGISASDRATTMRVASDPASTAADIIVPGHVVPVRVEEGGVLFRAGAPEAAVDLMLTAGTSGGATLCQILDEDGSAPSANTLERFAEEHGLQLLSSVDILDQRLGSERLVERLEQSEIETSFGSFRVFTYRDGRSTVPHYALVHGEIRPDLPASLSVRTQDFLPDVLGPVTSGGERSVLDALQTMTEQPAAVLLYLAAPGDPVAADEEDAATRYGAELAAAKRRAHVVTQILEDLDVMSVDVSRDQA